MNDISVVRKEINYVTITDEISSLKAKADKLYIDKKSSEVKALDLIKKIKNYITWLEDKRNYYVKPPNEYVKNVNNMFKPFSNELKSIDGIIRGKMIAYNNKREEEELKKAKAAIKEPIPYEPEDVKTTKIEGATISYKTIMKFEILDISKVPAEYMILDNVKVNSAIKDGVTQIPGLRIFEKKITALR